MAKRILCFGGRGNLGSSLLKTLSGYNLTSVDLAGSSQASVNNILIKGTDPKEDLSLIKQHLGKDTFDAILVASGGWKGGNIKADTFIEDYQHMHKLNLIPSLIAAHIASKHLTHNGMVLFTGASAVFDSPQPEMIGYALAKTGVHSLALNLSQHLPESNSVITILPITIDTPENRAAMPTSNFADWANPQQISELVKGWVDGLNRPSTGSFIQLNVANGCISPKFV